MVEHTLITQLTADAHAAGVRRLAVGAVVVRDDAVLVLRRNADDFMGGIYELPGGKVERGETLDQALVREVREESGLEVDAVGAYLGSFDYASAGGRRTRQFNFEVAVTGFEPVVLQEHDMYLWAPLSQDLPVTAAVRAVVTRFAVSRGPHRAGGGS